MPDLILLSLLLFQIKHFLCDFVLQTGWQVRHKGDYLHPAGFVHAGLHALGSIPAVMVLTKAPAAIAFIILIEFIIHYHVDWLKVRVDQALKLNHQNQMYWVIFGIDQFIHQLTYLAIVFVLVHYI
jgi:Protein of unknown function (DUF3307)